MSDPADQPWKSDAVLLVGHGTRDAEGVQEFYEVVRLLRERLALFQSAEPASAAIPVAAAFIELVDPTIEQALRQLAEQGAKRVDVLPLLLTAAGHAKEDVPRALEAAAKELGIEVRQRPHLGSDPAILELAHDRYQQALLGKPPISPSETLLVIVGRGSSDPNAVVELSGLASARAAREMVRGMRVCFVAAAQPSLMQTLPMAATAGCRRVVVQPHLLFAGRVLDEVRSLVAMTAQSYPTVEWIVTPHLGPSPRVVDALRKRLSTATT